MQVLEGPKPTESEKRLSEHRQGVAHASREISKILQSLTDISDIYLGRTLSSLDYEISLLEKQYRDLHQGIEQTKEKKVRFKALKERLHMLWVRARDGEVTTYESFDFRAVQDTWDLMLDVMNMRDQIDEKLCKLLLYDETEIGSLKQLIERNHAHPEICVMKNR